MLERCLGDCSEDELLAIMRARLGNQAMDLQWSDELYELDEAVEFLEKDDRKLVDEETKKLNNRKAAFDELKETFTSKAKDIGARKAAGAAAAAPAAGIARTVKFEFTISHREAARYLPAGASIWRSLADRRWRGHCPPNRRCSSRWGQPVAGRSEREALRECLRMLWSQHIALHGLGQDSCAVEGLF